MTARKNEGGSIATEQSNPETLVLSKWMRIEACGGSVIIGN